MTKQTTIDDIENELNTEKVKALISEIRGTSSADKLKKGVELIIKNDADKAKAKSEADKKVDKIKELDDKIKTLKTPPKTPETPETPEVPGVPETADAPETEEDEDKTAEIDKLTKQMEDMGKEIDALKKQKNYRTKPPEAEKVDEVDDFIKQNITKDFEVVI